MRDEQHQVLLDQLVDLLDRVVREQVGESLADTMQRFRRLAIERRRGFPDAESRLTGELSRLDNVEIRAVIRWLSLFFDLANLAEDRQRILILRQRSEAARRKGVPCGETIAATVHQLRERGCTAADLQRWLDCLKIMPVFTAHPSEAKRRTTRELLRRIRGRLPGLARSDAGETERRLLADLTALWQSDLVRPERPPVMSEVGRGLFFAATLWDVVPRIYRELRDALAETFPQHHFEIPAILAFGTWIGGDRDGHPYVTVDITRQTLMKLRKAAIDNHLAYCRDMLRCMVMSDQRAPSDITLRQTIEQGCQRWPELASRLEKISRFETYRRYLKLIEYRLEAALATPADDATDSAGFTSPEELRGVDRLGSGRAAGDSAGYTSPEELRLDLLSIKKSIAGHGGGRVADQFVQPWIDLVDTFGFHFSALDIRQNSDTHRRCLLEILGQQERFGDAPNDDLVRETVTKLEVPASVDAERLTPESREVFATFQLLAEEVRRRGTAPFGGYIISMTHSPLDIMTALWLWFAAWKVGSPDAEPPHLPIVPLFETIDDLQRAPAIMDELIQIPAYDQYLTARRQREQMVMVGYSDSTKDGGYLSACWELHQTQERLAEIADQYHLELTVFHGRGGALGRGGGPAARAIGSLPPAAVRGRLRVTEQGEVLAERYDDPLIAHRHLEQLVDATLLVSAEKAAETNPAWVNAISRMAEASFREYRELVQHPGFLDYFDQATPIGEIETNPIGSRPSRRSGRRSLSDLRAIPWTFAWTQSRHLLPAWYGFGTAVRGFVDQCDPDWSLVQTMYSQWPMFLALVENAELALAKADMEIAHDYAGLTNSSSGQEVWQLISCEFERSRAAVLMITGGNELLAGTTWLRASIQNRNPHVDPLNLAQIDLLRRQRQSEERDEELTDLIRLSIQGIAAGLRTTG